MVKTLKDSGDIIVHVLTLVFTASIFPGRMALNDKMH